MKKPLTKLGELADLETSETAEERWQRDAEERQDMLERDWHDND